MKVAKKSQSIAKCRVHTRISFCLGVTPPQRVAIICRGFVTVFSRSRVRHSTTEPLHLHKYCNDKTKCLNTPVSLHFQNMLSVFINVWCCVIIIVHLICFSLYRNMSIMTDNPTEAYRTVYDVWQRFGSAFLTVGGLIFNTETFGPYFEQALKELHADNVQYVETRALLGPVSLAFNCMQSYNIYLCSLFSNVFISIWLLHLF